MNVFVCVKQVPDTEARIEVKSDGSGISETGFKWIMNPYDEFAVEEAIKVKEKFPDAKVIALTIGPKSRTQDCLRTALALGADEAVLIDASKQPDFKMVARAIADAILKEGGADLIFSGKSAIDDNGTCVGPMIATILGFPHVSGVVKFTIATDRKITVEREIDGGSREVIDITTPCLIAATKGLNTPRYASLPNIMKAKKKPLKELNGSEFLKNSDRKVTFIEFKPPREKPPVKLLAGEESQQVKELVSLLKNEAKVL